MARPANTYGAENRGIRLLFIQPGKPTQYTYVERFNRTIRHECLDEHLFESIGHSQRSVAIFSARESIEKVLNSKLLISGRSGINENLIAISTGRPVVVSQLLG